jgi:Leucine-rich repeat (LRR) protein
METIVYNPYLFREIVRHLSIFELEALGRDDDFKKSLTSSVFDEVKLDALTQWINKFKPVTVTDLKTMTVLDLRYNKLTSLPDSIKYLKNLLVLDVRHNQLTSLPESIGQLENLQELWLNYNRLTSLPESIGHLHELEVLCLYGNQLTSVPESIGQLKKLLGLCIVCTTCKLFR